MTRLELVSFVLQLESVQQADSDALFSYDWARRGNSAAAKLADDLGDLFIPGHFESARDI